MKNYVWLLLTAALTCAFLLTGCETGDSTVPIDIIVGADGVTSYTVVRPDLVESQAPATTSAVSLRRAILDAGGEIAITTDFDGTDDNSSRCEILIGATNRELSARAAEGLSESSYRILYEGNKIAIVGGCDDALAAGVAEFIKTYIHADGQNAILALPRSFDLTDEAQIQAACPLIVTTVYPTKDLVVADVMASWAPYFADPTGTEDCSAALQKALDDCYALGGGTVWLPSGSYRMTAQVKIPPQVTLRGDRRDPDEGSGDYGTVILADVNSDIGTLFLMSANSGARGLTVYYPNQSASIPIDLGWTFEFRGEGVQGPAIGEITLINSYKGIGLSAPPYAEVVNSNMYIWGVKGTALSRGLVVYNNAGACSYEDLHFHNKYWAEAGETFAAPEISVLNTYTRAEGIAFTFGDLEMPLIYNLSADQYKYGVYTAEGPRFVFWGAGMAKLDIRDTEIALYIENHYTGRMSGLAASTLEGSVASVRMTNDGYLDIAGCELRGKTVGASIGLDNVDIPIPTYTEFNGNAKVTRTVIYDVTGEPYLAPYAKINTQGDLGGDCTAAIQAALDDAGGAGGGIVYLPAGHYSVMGNLTVPAGVELRGSGSIPNAPGPSGGTTIFLYAGADCANPETETAGITLTGDGAGVRTLQIFYPENPFAEPGTLVKYPYAIRILNADNAYAVDILLANPCYGIDISDGCDNHYIKRISGTAAYNLVRVGKTSDGWIETLHDINPGYWTIAMRYGISTPWMTDVFDHFHAFQKRYCDLIIINGATGENILDVLQFGAHRLITITDGEVSCWNTLADQGGDYCIYISGGYAVSYNSSLIGRTDRVNREEGGTVDAYNTGYLR